MTPSLRRAVLSAVAIASVLAPAAAMATNGYFTHGYGTLTKGMAGAGVALPQDTLIAATNPAGMAWVGKRYDAGVAVFNPSRGYTVTGNPSGFPGTFGLQPGSVQSDSEIFFIPHFGANWNLGGSTVGFVLYGHGGMNTDYPTSTFYAGQPTGVDLSQLFIGIPWAKKLGGGKHSIGIMPIIVYQQFEAVGVGSFAGFSASPANLSNNGKDASTGFGYKIGYLGKWTPSFSFGASYQSEMEMDEFSDYQGLFAEQGGFNVPPTWTVGIAVQATPSVTVAFDIQESLYSEIASVGSPLFPNLGQAFGGDPTSLLGGSNGPGFGWQDITTYKMGIQWKGAGAWTWRFGYSHGDQPIPSTEVLFNILAPGVIEDHITFGFTKDLGPSRSLNFALMHAPSSSVKGDNPLEVPGLQQIELEMDQWELEFSYSWGF